MPARKAQMCRWLAQAALPTSSRKQIHRVEWRGAVPRLAPSRLRRLNSSVHTTSLSGSSEQDASPHRLLHRRPAGNSATQQDEPSVRIAPAAPIGSSADDRPTPPLL